MELTAALLERCRPLLRLQVRRLQLDSRLRHRFDSSDLIQDALTRAVGRADQFRGSSEGEAIRWLQRILHTVVLNKVEEASTQARDYQREAPLQDMLADSSARMESFLAMPAPSPAECVERAELLLRLAEHVDRLPKDQGDVVNLRDLHGYKIEEIAQMLDKTEKSVAGLLLRGRQALRAYAIDIGLAPS
jgi:RNA polymerase sigma-70 factor (ECF subfamily)